MLHVGNQNWMHLCLILFDLMLGLWPLMSLRSFSLAIKGEQGVAHKHGEVEKNKEERKIARSHLA